ncbi:ABC transporter ATP-binding protein [Nocardia goodfellowii]|uniref:ATP-binding cassette subfamily B protein n=1 Tax=Nocardia goodfellowii TaxID=882446 RepID=A0ABS4Q8J0_9NOCA|nr:ABC transporter ATP-binding protein [Nocardia goodfellowii]MBP2188014.1 ATP-binding cassette subfamily B protein [Nocardia goodfellowii]
MSVALEIPAAEPEGDRLPRSGAAEPPGRLVSLRRFGPYVRPHRNALLAATGLALLSALTAIVIPVVIARIIDGPLARGDFAGVLWPVALVLVLGLLESVGVWGRRWLVSKPATQVEITMRAKIFRKLQALAIGRHDAWESGQLLSRAVDDMATLRKFIAFIGPFLLIHMVLIPVGIVVLVALNWRIGLLFAVIALPLTWFCVRFERKYAVASRRSQDQSGDLATTAEESAQGVRVLKAFGRGAFFGARFTAQSRELQQTELLKVRLDANLWSAMVAVPQLAIAFALGYGAFAVANGTMTLGTLVACITLANFLQWPIIWTGFLLAEWNDARTAADRYWEIIDTPIDITDPPDPVPLPVQIRGELRLDGVRFGFTPEPEDGGSVLEDISLTVRPGETVALVGATGSGKTALLNLIPRLYDVTGGVISIDGIDIATMRVSDLRSLVSVAFEEPVLFSASVRENVALGNPDASDDDVRRALDVAQATEFVDNLPWGLDTRIGEQGMSLSGGQRQRLALARAVLTGTGKGGRIMVLDDPLSALDVETEERVQERLRTVLADATTLLVAHRPSTAALADRVAVLADGRIVAEGTHDQLMRGSTVYRDLMGGE